MYDYKYNIITIYNVNVNLLCNVIMIGHHCT